MLQSIEFSKFTSHKVKISGKFGLRKDSHSPKFERIAQILVKLSSRELCDSKVSGLGTFDDNMAISLSQKIVINQKGRL